MAEEDEHDNEFLEFLERVGPVWLEKNFDKLIKAKLEALIQKPSSTTSNEETGSRSRSYLEKQNEMLLQMLLKHQSAVAAPQIPIENAAQSTQSEAPPSNEPGSGANSEPQKPARPKPRWL